MKLSSRTSTGLSDPALGALMKDLRNFISPAEAELIKEETALIAGNLAQHLHKEDLISIKNSSASQLHQFRSLAKDIMTEYDLRSLDHHITEIWVAAEENISMESIRAATQSSEVVDEHPCHPRNFSFSCVQALWRNLQ
jgi:hypothetical protein